MDLHYIISFITIRWLDVVDIVLVAFLIFQLYNLVKGTVAIKIFVGILAIYLLWKLVEAFQMEMLGEILGQFIGVGVIALLIVFQQELRRFLLLIGTSGFLSKKNNQGIIKKIMGQEKGIELNIDAIVEACDRMSASKTGALIVVAKKSDPSFYSSSGDKLDATLSARMIESIFFKNSPLHDGAIIIANDRIKEARCVLPVTENTKFPSEYGMRHRSAVGISENTDAIAIVVSEQTGAIAVAQNGDLTTNMNSAALEKVLLKEFAL